MDQWIMAEVDAPEPVSYDDIAEACRRILQQYGPTIECLGKRFGKGGNYSCRSLTEAYQRVRKQIDADPAMSAHELVGLCEEFVARHLKYASRYLTVVRTDEIDVNIIVSEVACREDIEVTDKRLSF